MVTTHRFIHHKYRCPLGTDTIFDRRNIVPLWNWYERQHDDCTLNKFYLIHTMHSWKNIPNAHDGYIGFNWWCFVSCLSKTESNHSEYRWMVNYKLYVVLSSLAYIWRQILWSSPTLTPPHNCMMHAPPLVNLNWISLSRNGNRYFILLPPHVQYRQISAEILYSGKLF